MAEKQNLQLDPKTIRKICLRYERELVGVKDWMFWFLMAWTIVFLAMEWLDFFFAKLIPQMMSAGYVVLLGSYIAHKEVLRWTGIQPKIRRGEFFVYIWWGMFLAMFLAEYIIGAFRVPEGMSLVAYEVLAYFLLTEISKALNTWRSARRHSP